MRKRLSESWREVVDTLPDDIPVEARRLLRHVFYCGAAAYVRGLEQASKFADGEVDVNALTARIVDVGAEMQQEIVEHAAKQRATQQARKN